MVLYVVVLQCWWTLSKVINYLYIYVSHIINASDLKSCKSLCYVLVLHFFWQGGGL